MLNYVLNTSIICSNRTCYEEIMTQKTSRHLFAPYVYLMYRRGNEKDLC